jgi:hypothetical protein
MSYPSIDERADIGNYPRMGIGGKRFLKEIEFQLFDNPSWTDRERVWWNAVRIGFLECVQDYEMEADSAYMKGIEYANQQAAS